MPSKLQKKRKKDKDYRASKKSTAATVTDVVISEDTEPDTDGESTGRYSFSQFENFLFGWCICSFIIYIVFEQFTHLPVYFRNPKKGTTTKK